MNPRTRRPGWRRSLHGFAVMTSTLAIGAAGTLAGHALTGTSPATLAATAADTPAATADDTAAADPAATPRSSFVLAALPDTQFYSRYSASQFYPKYGTNPFEAQTRWIVDHQDELNIPFTVHLGDVVDQEWVTGEFDAGKKAMDLLTEGGMPYSVLPGNHDVENMGARSSVDNSTNYLRYFGDATLSAQAEATGATLVGTYQQGLSSAYLFEAEGRTWMSLALAWNASDDSLDWAQTILDAHPGVPVVLTSHAIVNVGTDQSSPAYWWWGEHLWDRLIRKNDQIVLTASGHFHGNTMQTRTNDAGHEVYQVLSDFQMAADGGNGYMNLFEFDLTNDKINVSTVSPWVTQKDPDSLTSSDAPVLTGTWQDFSVDVDFGERFGWTLDPAEEDNGDLTAAAKEIASEGWDGGAGQKPMAPAGSSEDYVEVGGTVAHWRFGDVAEGDLTPGVEVPDVAGESPMRRNPVEATDADDELDDVQVNHDDVPFYSADQGAVCFDEVARTGGDYDKLGFLTTEYGAPATFADLTSTSGYTIETFLKLDEDWTETYNRWSAALTRGGVRSWTGINDSSDPGAGASWLGISSLREYQFTAGDTDTSNSYTLWSGEIMQGAWHHVAIVDDPVADTVIMYVDGVPVLRNASKVGGMKAADYMPWIIGASTWDNEPEHGWHGCVGETRIVDHALDSSQFLYQRVDIDGSGPNFALATDLSEPLAAGSTLGTLRGSGYPGATVSVVVDGTERGSATVASGGAWTVDLDTPISGAGSHAVEIVQSIGTRDGAPYRATVAIADEPAAPGPAPDALTTDTPTIAGTPVVGASVSAVPGEWTEGATFRYQWIADGAAIPGATDATFTIPASLAGAELAVAVTGAKDGYEPATETSAAVTVAKAALTTSAPTIAGEPAVGETVRAVPGSWTEGTAFAYQWNADGVAVPGATSARFAIPAALAGARLTVAVTGSKPGHDPATETSSGVAVAKGTLTSAKPRIKGKVRVGATVRVRTGSWTEGTTLRYRWFADGSRIKGANGRRLTIPARLAGEKLVVKVVGSKPGYQTARELSATKRVKRAKR
ncbi:LamG-like jellyroll fold domain-containing protein [Nocardioides sp. SYSU DS0663]|uniref:LamG-like jellyroll fold domain-containing protein n=1 Tax=Nocardioides sp. SYSU DS0663 TaxID=3416445 RepID=UPI003F4C31A6